VTTASIASKRNPSPAGRLEDLRRAWALKGGLDKSEKFMTNATAVLVGPRAALVPVIAALAFSIVALGAPLANAAPQIGQPAPDFTATDSKGKSLQLSQYRGKTVVLEWTNADCPYTRKHYTSGNMQSVQALAQKNGVVWLTVISSAPGKQGYVDGAGADALTESRGAVPTAVLLDPSGTVGRLYGAKTTPHMFVIDKNGALQYMGGIDSIATTDVSDIAQAEPYLKEAMLAVVQGSPVAHAATKPYGCAIKYQ
jgi:peroxiredoxin